MTTFMRCTLKGGLFCFILLLCNSTILQAQISNGGTPLSFGFVADRTDIPELQTSGVDLAAIQAEDLIRDQQNVPYRFAIPFKANYTLQNSGLWQTLSDGARLWRLQVTCPGAVSTNFLYSDFYLPEGAFLFVYNKEKTQVLGSYNIHNNLDSRLFATEILVGETAILEYYEPAEVAGQGVIDIEQISYGYRGVPIFLKEAPKDEQEEGLGDSGNCQVDVNCSPEGDNWQIEKKAAAMMVVNGTGFCSGTLINNTANDCTPYFLTAEHCIDGSYDAISNPNTNYMFYWNYERPTCNSTTAPAIQSTAGATILANAGSTADRAGSSDFALLLLGENPADAYDVYFAGFDASGATGTGGVGIHHPSADAKKIATHSTVPPSVVNNHYWRIYWDVTPNGQSVTEGGSSGSGLFRDNKVLIGQLFGGFDGGQPNCTDPAADEGDYGKLSHSWDNAGATVPQRRLKDWLDPLGGGTMTTMAGRTTAACGPVGTCAHPEVHTCERTESVDTSSPDSGSDIYNTHGGDNTWTGKEYVFRFTPNISGLVAINLTNTSAADLGIFVLSTCDPTMELASADANGAGGDEQLTYTMNIGTTYYIMIDARGNATATFDIEMDCPEPPSGCDVLSVLNCGDSKADTNIGATTAFTAYTGATYSYTGPEKIYEIVAGPGALTVDLTWTDGAQDLDLLLRSECYFSAGTTLAEGVTGTVNETVSFTVPAGGGTYFVVVEGYAGASSNYTLSATCSSVTIAPKIYLQGAFNGTDMTTNLNSSLVPMTEPYTALGYSYVGGGGETSNSAVITANDVTDWVVVELRDAATPTTIVASAAALLRKDGTVANRLDGTSALAFPFATGTSYYVAIKHRNHLSVMSNAAIGF